ncbi:P-loop containing nucleoside triphosphate hydrolase protein [Corynespora cassiicola Philippines]|uniref:P-loop containing nucleoside triphosphate hydrolase protein n=1 Tax=Corynespora cassiicola Philippines TaxID=1448308 RepID=A0A2T2P082_CORCC|nr:P-loop containing nucleoside triphosphate hydrolase protein [Corynespora cassiicola Philippines]
MYPIPLRSCPPTLYDGCREYPPRPHQNIEGGDIGSDYELDLKTPEQEPLGMTPELKELYRRDEYAPWNEKYPGDIVGNMYDPATAAKYALVVRKQPDRSGKGGLMLCSITIQSPLIRGVLSEVFKNFRGISTKLKNLTFSYPFHEFFHRCDSFNAQTATCTDRPTLQHMELLREVLVPCIQPDIDRRDDLLKHGLISYDFLWALFEPGTEIYSEVHSHDRIFLLLRTQYERGIFSIICRYVEYDGHKFGYNSTSLSLSSFDGVISISELDVIPAQFHPEADRLKSRLWNRAKVFEKLTGVHYKSYTGQYIPRRALSHVLAPAPMESGRIMIDAKVFYEHNPKESLRLSSLSCVHEITFSTDAFPRLVLPHDYKELILAFATNQLSSNDTFDDVIKGKGKGMTILLHGEPGVGKTLTVEATSEEMRKPLYIMSAGELGYSASEVEDKLRKVLDVTTKWGAILLIDECDIFLEKRTVSDIERNKLVAIFLRALEYFKGIMFLTTNRIGTFDAAFQSRIHLTINYPALDFESRKHIWKTFLPGTSGESDVEKVPRHVISESDIFDLALIALNGREIKNIVKSARLLSASKQVPLSISHIDTVLRVKGILLAED